MSSGDQIEIWKRMIVYFCIVELTNNNLGMTDVLSDWLWSPPAKLQGQRIPNYDQLNKTKCKFEINSNWNNFNMKKNNIYFTKQQKFGLACKWFNFYRINIFFCQ